MPPLSFFRVNHSAVIRVLAVVLGILVGLGVYSYGMFHTLLPTWSNLVDVAHCGVAPGAPYHAEETTISGHRPFMGGTQKRDYNPTRLCAELNGDAQEEFAKIGLQGRAVDQR